MGNSIAKTYARELKRKLDRFGVWKPGDGIKLGDILVIEKGLMEHRGNIDHFGIMFEEEVMNCDPENTEDYMSKNAVKVTSRLDGPIPGTDKVKARVEIGFSRNGAVYYSSKGIKNIRIKDPLELEKQIIGLYRKDKWRKDYAVVTQVTVADSAVIVISESSGASVELTGQADAGNENFRVTDLDLGFSFSRESNVAYRQQFKSPTPLLFRARSVKESLRRSPRMARQARQLVPDYAGEFEKLAGEKSLQYGKSLSEPSSPGGLKVYYKLADTGEDWWE